MLRRLSFVGLALIIWVSAVAAADAVDGLPGYQTVTPSRDGIGKLYLGREISQVMGHRGAAWLERTNVLMIEFRSTNVTELFTGFVSEYCTRSSSGMRSRIASINADLPAALVLWMITARGLSSFRETAAR